MDAGMNPNGRFRPKAAVRDQFLKYEGFNALYFRVGIALCFHLEYIRHIQP